MTLGQKASTNYRLFIPVEGFLGAQGGHAAPALVAQVGTGVAQGRPHGGQVGGPSGHPGQVQLVGSSSL